RHRGEVHHAAATDAVSAQQAHPVPDHEVEDPGVGAELEVVGELLAGQPRAALQHDHPGAAGGQVVRGDGATEPAADDDHVGTFDVVHFRLPVAGSVSGCRGAIARP